MSVLGAVISRASFGHLASRHLPCKAGEGDAETTQEVHGTFAAISIALLETSSVAGSLRSRRFSA